MFKQIGGLLVLLGFSMALPLMVSLIYGEYFSASGFLLSSLICILFGYSLYKGIKSNQEPLNRHALIIAALGWLFIALFGALPFFLIAYLTPA
ncbi:MAG: hypothetical protein JXR22_01570, partial [Prolixibacteraceae bacterium]|nr:hypothetical protein [Prolixibacteraceae bacterium]